MERRSHKLLAPKLPKWHCAYVRLCELQNEADGRQVFDEQNNCSALHSRTQPDLVSTIWTNYGLFQDHTQIDLVFTIWTNYGLFQNHTHTDLVFTIWTNYGLFQNHTQTDPVFTKWTHYPDTKWTHYPDTEANQFLPYPNNAECHARQQQVSILKSLVWLY